MVHGCAKRGAVSHRFERIRHWNAADILWKVLSHRKSTKQRRNRFHLAWFYCSLPLHCNVIRYFVNSCKNRFSLEIWPNSSSLPDYPVFLFIFAITKNFLQVTINAWNIQMLVNQTKGCSNSSKFAKLLKLDRISWISQITRKFNFKMAI